MKVQCPSCKEIVEMSHFATSVEGLSFTCPACAREHFLPSPGRQPAGDDIFSRATREYPSLAALPAALAEEGVTCPKCGNFQNDSYACHRCGLVFEKFDPAALPADPEEAASVWREIESRPLEAELHERFLQACRAARRLDYAARQYRLLERRPGMEDTARRYQQRLAQIAQSSLPAEIMPSGGEKRPPRKMFWLLVALAALGGLICWLLSEYGRMR